MDVTARGARGNLSGSSLMRLPMQLFSDELPASPRVAGMLAHNGESEPHPEPIGGGPVLVMPPPPSRPSRGQVWMQRIWLAVFVLFCLEVGIILTVLPWTRIWADNSLLLGYPQLREFLMQGFVRGVVTGLGLVDIWMGVAEAVRYREHPDA